MGNTFIHIPTGFLGSISVEGGVSIPAMAVTLIKAKAEERSASKLEDPPAKRPCSQWEQKMSKMESGDLSLVKERQ